jgi:hypothetical protein
MSWARIPVSTALGSPWLEEGRARFTWAARWDYESLVWDGANVIVVLCCDGLLEVQMPE